MTIMPGWKSGVMEAKCLLGACEPEEILNKGWLDNASSRAMMAHSRVFDTMIPEGEVIGKDGMVTMLNELKTICTDKEITVSVKDSHGNRHGCRSFEVLNYSEYAPDRRTETYQSGKSQPDNRAWKYPYFCKDVCRGRMAACRKQPRYKNRGLL